MKTFLLAILATISRFFKRYHELITLPIAFGLWLISVPVLRYMDPTAAVFDAGIFQVPIFSIIQLLVFLSVAWIILKIVFGNFYRFIINDMKSKFTELTPWQQLKISYSVYFLLVAALVLLAKSAL